MANAGSLTLLNPHADDFVSVPLSFMLVGRRGLCKYKYLVEEPIRHGLRPSILIDGTLSSVIDQRLFNRFPKWLRDSILRVEIYLWLRFNGLAPNVDVHRSIDTIKDRTALYIFSYKNCVGSFDRRIAAIYSFKCALINLSHYFIRTGEKAGNIEKLRNAHLVSEGDLSQNPCFQHFFSKKLVSVVPFAISDRFTMERPLAERDAKCAATGSFHNLNEEEPFVYYREFIEFFKTDTYHPVRKMLHQHREELSGWLTSRMSPYRETKGNNKSIGALLRNLLRLDVAQSEYFSFDMVDFYNQHQFAIVGEELSGAPAVGFFEAMACGCVTLGQRGAYYNGLGLEPNVHYLRHDGTIESIKEAIDQAIADPARAARISKAGIAYIANHCTQEHVWNKLKVIWHTRNKGGNASEPAPIASIRG